MQPLIIVEQLLNGVQLGITLFLLAAGLTLVLGIMNLINLAHASMYMVGAYLSATVYLWSGSFLFGVVAALTGALLLGVLIELVQAPPEVVRAAAALEEAHRGEA